MAKTPEEYREDYVRNRVIEEMLIDLGRKTLIEKKLKLDAAVVEQRVRVKLATMRHKNVNKFAGLIATEPTEEEMAAGEKTA